MIYVNTVEVDVYQSEEGKVRPTDHKENEGMNRDGVEGQIITFLHFSHLRTEQGIK